MKDCAEKKPNNLSRKVVRNNIIISIFIAIVSYILSTTLAYGLFIGPIMPLYLIYNENIEIWIRFSLSVLMVFWLTPLLIIYFIDMMILTRTRMFVLLMQIIVLLIIGVIMWLDFRFVGNFDAQFMFLARIISLFVNSFLAILIYKFIKFRHEQKI
jgi:hypothetical protein